MAFGKGGRTVRWCRGRWRMEKSEDWKKDETREGGGMDTMDSVSVRWFCERSVRG